MLNDSESQFIIPAIMPVDYQDLDFKVGMVDGAVTRVQIDVMDGKFVRALSWPFTRSPKGSGAAPSTSSDQSESSTLAVPQAPTDEHIDINFKRMQNEQEGMPCWSTIDYDADLMVENPAYAVDQWASVGVTRVILHLREHNQADISVAIGVAKERMLEVSIALMPVDISPAILRFIFETHINDISGIQCMGVDNIGFQREHFNPKTFSVLKTLKDELHAYNATLPEGAPKKELELSVDGGVTHENARPLFDAGATKLVSGSTIFDADAPRQAIEFFNEILAA
jgi:ribulose-phosphate 3-epimerase